jgi:hypothetical protein
MVTDSYTFQQLSKQYMAEQAGFTDWTNYLKGIREAYKPQTEYVEQRAAYDISGAYANYKQSQLDLLRNRNISESLRNKIESATKSQYQSMYGSIKSQELEGLSSIQNNYTAAIEAQEKAAKQQASTLEKLTQALYTFGGIDESKVDVAKGAKGLGYYATKALEEGGTETYLTPYGKAGLGDLVFNGVTTTNDEGESTTQSFRNYLYNTDKDLYEAFMSDPDAFYRTLGFEPGTREFSKEDSEMMVAAEDIAQDIKTNYSRYYDENKTFESDKEKYDYYTKLKDTAIYETRGIEGAVDAMKKKYVGDTVLGGRSTTPDTKSDIFADDLNKMLRQDAFSFINADRYATGAFDSTAVKVDVDKLTEEEKQLLKPFFSKGHSGETIIVVTGGNTSANMYNYKEVISALSLVSNKEKERKKVAQRKVKEAVSKIPSYIQSTFNKAFKKEK